MDGDSMQAVTGDSDVPLGVVRLHVYNATKVSIVSKANVVLKALGTGIFHSAVEVFGEEFGYGACWIPGRTGVYRSVPGHDAQHTHCEVLDLGKTPMNPEEVHLLIKQFEAEWQGMDYDIVMNNCSHFSEALCSALGVGPIPNWIQSLARIGAMAKAIEATVGLHLCSRAKLLRSWEAFMAVRKPAFCPGLLQRIRNNLIHFHVNYLLAALVAALLFLVSRPRRLLGAIVGSIFAAALLGGRDPQLVLHLGIYRTELSKAWLAATVFTALVIVLVREALLLSAVVAILHATIHPGERSCNSGSAGDKVA